MRPWTTKEGVRVGVLVEPSSPLQYCDGCRATEARVRVLVGTQIVFHLCGTCIVDFGAGCADYAESRSATELAESGCSCADDGPLDCVNPRHRRVLQS